MQSHAWLTALVASALLCVIADGGLHAVQAAHANTLYILLLHAFVLPFLLLYWRANRNRADIPFQLPRWDISIAVVFIILAMGTSWVTRHWPMISDESAYRFQARIFASGRLKADPMPGAPVNPVYTPPEIDFAQTIQTPHGWFAKYPPVWPLILAGGYLLRCPWLVNPVFGGLQLLLMWRIARLWGVNTAVLAVVMAASSTYALAYDGAFMSHASNAVVCMLALGSVLKGVRETRLSPIAVCFLLVALSTEIRPYTGAVLGVVCTAIATYAFRKSKGMLARTLGIILGSAVLAVVVLLIMNHLFTGDALLSSYALSNGGRKIQELTLVPAQIAGNVLHMWRWAITDTIRFTFPFMFLFAIYACWKDWNHRLELISLSLLFPALILAYLIQTMGSGSIYGERFYFEGFPAIAIVAGRGLDLLVCNWQIRRSAFLAALAVLLALQAATLGFAASHAAALSHPYEEAYDLAHARQPGSLVFLRDHTPPFTSKHVNWNAADWRASPRVYVNDPGPARREAVACLFGRPRYSIVQYDSETGHMFATEGFAHCSFLFPNSHLSAPRP